MWSPQETVSSRRPGRCIAGFLSNFLMEKDYPPRRTVSCGVLFKNFGRWKIRAYAGEAITPALHGAALVSTGFARLWKSRVKIHRLKGSPKMKRQHYYRCYPSRCFRPYGKGGCLSLRLNGRGWPLTLSPNSGNCRKTPRVSCISSQMQVVEDITTVTSLDLCASRSVLSGR